ncbi:hypothetical protein LTR10_017330 [Elasticomyces elasticus]|uniref:Luciferase-like domain-containing protein n=1 Tax=Exophiala sideris TaxID=1016849 RepID=A0ABR0J8V5_9EURO|nr:hypothetical protein LTR10_017330 [Elasticomyces elasticus]KAK5027913.1 hypothetical protein LTS07_006789 [Exophiala sideris]KAK5037497.1 hypothetical protein LTR13_004654 [Exophiala sideris]KAK5059158.1 hypothetical protein LTR69_006447 [Exophiala sideris]KAK5182992.1 hypothetical protein LTR44_004702 [Eurotiomycetes sp. CCFEE 6388]
MSSPMDVGVFIPIGNNGWIISENAPQYKPSFELNKQVVQKAEGYGFDFALSMIKLRGYGGKTEHWDHNLESFTLMSALAAVTSKIKVFATAAVLTLPPAMLARMATTIDSVAPGRFGINIVTGWQAAEYSQMGLWPGNAFFGYRYEYASEYVQVMKDLWKDSKSDFKGKYFQMDDCKLSPTPSSDVKLVVAGESDRGMEFAAKYCDYNFVKGLGTNTPTAAKQINERLLSAAAKTGRDVGAYVLFMIIAEATDKEAEAKWQHYRDGVDVEAVAWMSNQAGKDKSAAANSTAKTMILPEGAVNMNIGTLVGSYEKVAAMLDEAASVEGTKGLLLIFDDYLPALDKFGKEIQPRMKCRAHIKVKKRRYEETDLDS